MSWATCRSQKLTPSRYSRRLRERHERRALILTTNLPRAEWTTLFPDPRLCRAVINRLTHRAHIIETGLQSIRIEEAMRRHPLTLTEEV